MYVISLKWINKSDSLKSIVDVLKNKARLVAKGYRQVEGIDFEESAVPSTAHGMIKFPVMGGILTLKGSKIIPVECAMVSGPEEQPILVNKVKEERVKVAINPEHLEQTVMMGSDLTEKTRSKLCNLLQRSLDIFAWTPTDMTGIPRQIAEHRLNVRKGCQPVRQKKRGQAAERNVAINDEVSKLMTAGIMREVHYHDWLSNPVMVKKSDNSWRMCVDFKDLNKACPKDGYPLPKIDRKVESLCGFPFKCFLDAYKGYHQIQMAEEDEEKTAFITNQGIFCYTKMPFGLRNAGVTYQRLVDKTFHEQIGRNLKVYVDDLVIKSRTEDEVVCDIEETFKTLRKINMKLNQKKCTFGVEEGMFLGYQDNTKGIKICPDKEAEAAFRQMKEHIAKLPMLTAPEEQEELIVYLAASKEAVSAVLMTEREARPRVSVKGQVLADFIVERPEEEGQDDSAKEEEPLLAWWTLFTDRVADSGKNRRPKPPSKCRLKTSSKPSKWDLHRKIDRHDQILREGKSTGQYLPGVFNTAGPKKQEQKSECTKQNDIHQLRTSQQTGPSQANYVLREIHEGSCSMHAGTRSVIAKALRTGYYWPTMHEDARALIRACQECQVHKPVLRNPQEKLNLITSLWPFYKWGIDIAGPFPEGPGKVKFLIVVVDYFTKWIEAKPVATITGNQTNGLVERANRSLGEGIKIRLGKDNKNWIEEISHVLWAHRTIIKTSNGDTPFSLTYGTEAVIPAEIRMPTFRTAEVDMDKNDEAFQINLELLEEKREQAAIA
ncbi:reverse transcriptase domain-containing protein [Tanacetum coccineum]